MIPLSDYQFEPIYILTAISYIKYIKKFIYKIIKYIRIIIKIKRDKIKNTYMRACTMNKRSRLKNANLIFISCSYFSCVSTAIQTTDSYIIMYSSRYYLNSFEITGQNYYITTSCICLQQFIPL